MFSAQPPTFFWDMTQALPLFLWWWPELAAQFTNSPVPTSCRFEAVPPPSVSRSFLLSLSRTFISSIPPVLIHFFGGYQLIWHVYDWFMFLSSHHVWISQAIFLVVRFTPLMVDLHQCFISLKRFKPNKWFWASSDTFSFRISVFLVFSNLEVIEFSSIQLAL